VFLDVPLDVQFNGAPPDLEMPQRYRTNAKPQGDPDLVARAAALLRKASHPIVLAGAGVRWSGAHEALAEMAHALKAPVFLNSLGRGCLSPDDPYYFSAARRFALQQADVVLALGVDWDFRLGYGTRGFGPFGGACLPKDAAAFSNTHSDASS
jgi:acetolactate synthase-1/2/3 large subunit